MMQPYQRPSAAASSSSQRDNNDRPDPELKKLKQEIEALQYRVYLLEKSKGSIDYIIKEYFPYVLGMVIVVAFTWNARHGGNNLRNGGFVWKHGVFAPNVPKPAYYTGFEPRSQSDTRPYYGDLILDNGVRLEGIRRSGKLNGYGSTWFPNVGLYYSGILRNNQPDGYGSLIVDHTTADNNVSWISYQGEHRDGDFNGRGVLRWKSGKVYEGQFVNDLPHGEGVYYEPTNNHSTYIGEVANGKRNGRGMTVWPDGIRYEGIWKEGKPVGNGTYFVPLHRRVEGNLGDYHHLNFHELEQHETAGTNVPQTETER